MQHLHSSSEMMLSICSGNVIWLAFEMLSALSSSSLSSNSLLSVTFKVELVQRAGLHSVWSPSTWIGTFFKLCLELLHISCHAVYKDGHMCSYS